jgi:hypothetical protein
MLRNMIVISALLAAATVWATPLGIGEGRRPEGRVWRLGVGLTVDSGRVAVECYCCHRDRGTAVRDQAWADGPPSRGAKHVRLFHLGAVPHRPGAVYRGLVVARAIGRAARATVRHLVSERKARKSARTEDTGENNADRG